MKGLGEQVHTCRMVRGLPQLARSYELGLATSWSKSSTQLTPEKRDVDSDLDLRKKHVLCCQENMALGCGSGSKPVDAG